MAAFWIRRASCSSRSFIRVMAVRLRNPRDMRCKIKQDRSSSCSCSCSRISFSSTSSWYCWAPKWSSIVLLFIVSQNENKEVKAKAKEWSRTVHIQDIRARKYRLGIEIESCYNWNTLDRETGTCHSHEFLSSFGVYLMKYISYRNLMCNLI